MLDIGEISTKMKNWKEGEKRLTAWLSEQTLWKAVRKSRAMRGDAVEDIEWGPFSVEYKSRKTIPQYMKEWMAQVEKNSEGRMPIVVWHEDRMRMGKQFVVMPLELFAFLAGCLYNEEVRGE